MRRRAFLLAAGLALTVVACGGGDDNPDPTRPDTPSNPGNPSNPTNPGNPTNPTGPTASNGTFTAVIQGGRGSGTVTIPVLTANRVAGTFSGDLMPGTGGASGVLAVREGAFDVTY